MRILFVILFAAFNAFPQTAAVEPTDEFWRNLQSLCGKSFEGAMINAPPGDTTFKDKRLVMNVRKCEENVIKIPFAVGDDRSRTWILTRRGDRILLKHDHRHEDGKPDAVTMYGGLTSNSGSASLQMFPADQETVSVIAAAATNVWWIELVPGEYFTYNLRRMGTDRFFSIKFDLKKPVTAPPAPWGWEEKTGQALLSFEK